MIRKVAALPMIYVLSRVVGFVGLVGGLVNPAPVFNRLFDWIIGVDRAERSRDEHAEALVGAVAAHDIEYRTSKQVLIKETRENHRASISRISRGESVVSISIALLAVFANGIPPELGLPFGVSIALPSLNGVLFLLTIMLVVSVFFREVAVETLAFSAPSVFDSYDELMTQLAWNGGTLSQSRVAYNTLLLQILRDWDESFYQLYLGMIADYVEKGGFPKRKAWQRYGADAMEIVNEKYEWLDYR